MVTSAVIVNRTHDGHQHLPHDLSWWQILLPPSPRCSRQVHGLGDAQTVELPKNDVSLREVFRTVLQSKSSLGVMDWGISNATLESAFQHIVASSNINTVT